jgi:hypothetical protein
MTHSLWPERTVLVDTASSKETVLNHALAKQKDGYRQGHQKQKLSDEKPLRPLPCGECRLCVNSHFASFSGKLRIHYVIKRQTTLSSSGQT